MVPGFHHQEDISFVLILLLSQAVVYRFTSSPQEFYILFSELTGSFISFACNTFPRRAVWIEHFISVESVLKHQLLGGLS